MSTDKFFYWYRQTTPRPAGQWVIAGPYDVKVQAQSARERDKIDGQVGVVFSAASKDEAEKRTFHQ